MKRALELRERLEASRLRFPYHLSEPQSSHLQHAGVELDDPHLFCFGPSLTSPLKLLGLPRSQTHQGQVSLGNCDSLGNKSAALILTLSQCAGLLLGERNSEEYKGKSPRLLPPIIFYLFWYKDILKYWLNKKIKWVMHMSYCISFHKEQRELESKIRGKGDFLKCECFSNRDDY